MILETTKVKLFYEKSGTGQPLILLHGNGETHEIFKKAIPILEAHFTVYAIDTRGHGQSSERSELHYEDMAQDIYEFICSLELEQPIIYGFSDGGIVALLLSVQHKTLLSRIIVSGVNTQPAGIKTIWLGIFRLSYAVSKSNAIKLMLNEPDISDEMLHKIQIPVYLTAGSRDMIKEPHLRHIAAHIKTSILTIFPKETHASYVVNSTKIAHYILKEIAYAD